MVDARLHPADVVAHDEEDVGLRLLCASLLIRRRKESEHREQTDAQSAYHMHETSPVL